MPSGAMKLISDLIHTVLSLTGGYLEREHSIQLVPRGGAAMNLLEQAARAERLARTVMDAYATDALMRYARECRDLAGLPAELSRSPAHPVVVSDAVRFKDTGRQLAL